MRETRPAATESSFAARLREPGAVLSLVLHGAAFAFGLYGLPSHKTFEPASESVAVDMISEKQFNELMQGDKASKLITKEPERRVDTVADTKKDAPEQTAKKDVAQAEPPPPKAEPKPATPVPPAPPPPPPPVPVPVPPVPLRPVAAPKVAPQPVEEEDDPEDTQAELVRQKPPKRPEPPKPEPPKPEPAKPEPLKTDALRKVIEAEDKAAQDKAAQQKALKDKAERETKERAEKERAEKDKAAREKAAREAADAKKFSDSINKVLASKEQAASSGATGATPSQRASAGTANATGKSISPSEKAQLIGILTEQMSRCISYAGAYPRTGPEIVVTLGRGGELITQPQLANSSAEASFTPFAEATMRALRNCQPYRIPPRFLESYDSWKNLRLFVSTTDMR